MGKNSRDPVHCWLVLGKAFRTAAKYLYAGLRETGIDDTDFRILEALLNKGPLPVNTIGPKVFLTPGSISVAIDRLLDRRLVSRVESPEDRRVWIGFGPSLSAFGPKLDPTFGMNSFHSDCDPSRCAIDNDLLSRSSFGMVV